MVPLAWCTLTASISVAARVDIALLRAGVDARLAFPVTHVAHPGPNAVEWLASRHPDCTTVDLDAALHASSSHLGLVLDTADRLLMGARSLPPSA